MELALYAPGLGYYGGSGPGGGLRPVGRGGDFYTSVSVGETFGWILAHRIAEEWTASFARDETFVVVEQGGHDGRLARDIVGALGEIDGALPDRFEYRLVEPRAHLFESLAEGLADCPRIRVVPSLAAARSSCGIFLCNELLDAFPVDLLVFEGGEWREKRVAWDAAASAPCWTTAPLPESYAAFVGELGKGFPEDYTTEVCPGIEPWMAEAAGLFDRGLWWIVDYGFERADYYLPERTRGTLRCYRGHRAGEDPFEASGEQDITAHVDFTRVEEAAARAGLRKRRLTDQNRFLVSAARPWLLSIDGRAPGGADAKRIRQFQTLSHPSLMGAGFRVLELERS